MTRAAFSMSWAERGCRSHGAARRTAVLLGALLLALLLVAPACAAPHRQKRVSDQRLAELETRMALNKLKGIVVTVPVGFGKVNPAYLGRRRRSEDDALARRAAAGAAAEAEAAAEGEEADEEEEERALEEAEGGVGGVGGGRLAHFLAALQLQRPLRSGYSRFGLQMQ